MERARSENRKTAALWLFAAACLLLAPGMAEAGKKAKSKWAKKEPKTSVQPAKPKPQGQTRFTCPWLSKVHKTRTPDRRSRPVGCWRLLLRPHMGEQNHLTDGLLVG